jgi:hypothetical protein
MYVLVLLYFIAVDWLLPLYLIRQVKSTLKDLPSITNTPTGKQTLVSFTLKMFLDGTKAAQLNLKYHSTLPYCNTR